MQINLNIDVLLNVIHALGTSETSAITLVVLNLPIIIPYQRFSIMSWPPQSLSSFSLQESICISQDIL